MGKYLEVAQGYQDWLDAPEHLHVLQVEGEELYLNAVGLIPEKDWAFRFHDEVTARQYLQAKQLELQLHLKPVPL